MAKSKRYYPHQTTSIQAADHQAASVLARQNHEEFLRRQAATLSSEQSSTQYEEEDVDTFIEDDSTVLDVVTTTSSYQIMSSSFTARQPVIAYSPPTTLILTDGDDTNHYSNVQLDVSDATVSSSSDSDAASLDPSQPITPDATVTVQSAAQTRTPVPLAAEQPMPVATPASVTPEPTAVQITTTSTPGWWQTITNWFRPTTNAAPTSPTSSVTTVAANESMSSPYKKMTLTLQTNIEYKALPIEQPSVFSNPISPKNTPTPTNSTTPTAEKLEQFNNANMNGKLKEFYAALSNAFKLCTENQFGGLKQHIPSGIRFMQDWLNYWVNCADPNIAAWSTLKVIGNEANKRQGSISSWEGIHNYLKKLFTRDEYVASVYEALEGLSTCAGQQNTERLSEITNKLNNLHIAQQQKIEKVKANLEKVVATFDL